MNIAVLENDISQYFQEIRSELKVSQITKGKREIFLSSKKICHFCLVNY